MNGIKRIYPAPYRKPNQDLVGRKRQNRWPSIDKTDCHWWVVKSINAMLCFVLGGRGGEAHGKLFLEIKFFRLIVLPFSSPF